MKSYSVTDVGQKRRENQDYVYASEQPIGNLPNLFVVADGMGGHNAGDFASCLAVNVLVEAAKKDMSFNPIKIIRHAIETANEQVYEQARQDPSKAGMGTTLVVVTIVGYYAYVANVGDSRLYMSDQHALTQITRDHSWIAEMVRRGELSREEAKNHPDKNIITRAIGGAESVSIDFFDVQLEEESKIFMCSDGLSNMVEDEKIQEILSSSLDIEQSASQLVDLANDNGGKDNISVIIIEPFTNEVKEC
ncbi:MAG: Stp1/IreP family PP2C-type Ser/Thr phosphatase [Clostridia bacterium]|nr:Stp1/IreP family PP2C-type Ser/Thr phosphatase [Clostridia bacterium]NCC42247.1 Stp1/IreP family PP2C-type Ser/Thr phosphatase [Clostridia bacterium]